MDLKGFIKLIAFEPMSEMELTTFLLAHDGIIKQNCSGTVKDNPSIFICCIIVTANFYASLPDFDEIYKLIDGYRFYVGDRFYD